ncbi:hypothetical protein BDZ94DRAFT_1272713 [Collybia nuda]|uniref:Uncharacterized protein n=1 Tax=Collybia nuda TaxID=64659 RepID=A0A9P5XXY2_9AGAR|nr:hypothetical protein BDZ94DRAFT_1272713 [Collybia nuda]
MRRAGTSGIMPVGTGPSKPMFGGPWGRHNHVPPPPQQQQSYFGSGNNTGYNMGAALGHNAPVHSPPTQAPYNPEYPPPTGGPAPPPPYGTESSNLEQGGNYGPPPGPPPPAHTKGHNGSFVGGFRS